MASGKTTRYQIPFPKTTDNDTLCADQESMMKSIDEVMNEVQDYLQAGTVSSSDWSFTANIVEPTGELGSTGEVAESLAWLPEASGSKLMRSKTAKASIAKKALSSGSLPAVGKFSAIAFELTASTWNAAATVTTHAGAEQATQLAAEEHLPSTTAGKMQVKVVIVEAKAGPNYAIVGSQRDVRPWTSPSRVGGSLNFLSWGNISSAAGIEASSGDFTVSKTGAGKYEVAWNHPKASAKYAVVVTAQEALGTFTAAMLLETKTTGFTVFTTVKESGANSAFSFAVVAAS